MDLSHSFMETLLEFESKLLITAQRRNLEINRVDVGMVGTYSDQH